MVASEQQRVIHPAGNRIAVLPRQPGPVRIEIGLERHNRGDADGAADDYKKALFLDPNDPEALLWLGYHYDVSGRPDLARALMDRLQHAAPLTPINLTMYGMVAMFETCS